MDQLSFSSSVCSREKRDYRSGFELLCQEGIKFTHAYTTSTLSLPAMSSVLTGEDPWQTHLRTNNQFLSSVEKTLAEKAAEQGYNTGLVTGGPPLLRASGLQQGFLFFDDNITPTPKWPLRPAKQSVASLMNWLTEVESPFLSWIYLPDLAFPEYQTVNDLGENRPLTWDAQFEEVDSQLFRLFQWMKKTNRWNNTWIVLHSNQGQGRFDQLRSSVTQIFLMIKPPPMNKNLNSEVSGGWSMNRYVSLSDVGATLEEILRQNVQKKRAEEITTELGVGVSFLEELNQKSDSTAGTRPLITLSDWALWKGIRRQVSFSIRSEELLYIEDQAHSVYNALTDRFENSALPSSDNNFLKMLRRRDEILNNHPEINRWSDVSPSPVPNATANPQNCLDLLGDVVMDNLTLKKCPDKIALALIEWHHRDNSETKKKAIRMYNQYLIGRKLVELNQNSNEPWDVNPRFMESKKIVDLIINDSRFAKFKIQLNQDSR